MRRLLLAPLLALAPVAERMGLGLVPEARRALPARLVERLHRRQSELDRERQISALPPVLKGAALVIPGGLLKAKAPPAAGRDSGSAG